MPYTADGSAAGARPGHEYTYGPGDVTTVADDGPAGDRTVGFDPAGRLLVATDATGHKSEYRWNAADRLLTTTTAAQTALASTTAVIYDDDDAVGGAGYGNPDRVQSSDRVTHGFGPAAPSCFSVAADVVTVSCPAAPHTRTQYDAPGGTDKTGLAVTGWDNRDFAGAPRLRDESVHTGGTLVDTDLADLPAGTAGVWSARYTGEIELGTGSYAYGLAATGGSARLFVDDTLVADSTAGGTGTKPSDIAGRHRFRVDFSATATDPELVISWTPPGQSSRDIASSDLAPRWAAPTTTTTDDDLGVPAMVASVEYESLFTGLVQKSIVDPEGLNLVTTVANEAGLLRRTTSRTLPANDPEVPAAATVYAYYANTASGAAACGQAAGVNQGGRVQTTTAPSPDGTASGRQVSVVYDPAGRVLATRVGSEDWSCLNYDRKGRITTRSFPADADQGGHIYTFNYDNPLVTLSKEGATTHSTTVSDMLGRVVSYTDRWAKTTTSTYDQSGRRTATSGPAGNLGVTYDAAGRVLTQSHDGALMATATSYDAAGALAAATYTTALGGGNGTTLAVARHPATGAVTKLTWANPAGAAIATDEVVRSLAGKVVDEKTDGSDAFGAWGTEAGANFVYDAAGRLDLARVEGQSLDYGFATSAGCGSQAAPGRNANRSSVSLNGATPTTYCYDRADRLTSSSDTAVGTPTYDGHGNTATLGTQTLSYDGADRHMSSTVAGGPTVTYERDASDRIVSRTEGATVIHYGFAGPGDSSGFTMDASNNVTERMIALMGGPWSPSGPPCWGSTTSGAIPTSTATSWPWPTTSASSRAPRSNTTPSASPFSPSAPCPTTRPATSTTAGSASTSGPWSTPVPSPPSRWEPASMSRRSGGSLRSIPWRVGRATTTSTRAGIRSTSSTSRATACSESNVACVAMSWTPFRTQLLGSYQTSSTTLPARRLFGQIWILPTATSSEPRRNSSLTTSRPALAPRAYEHLAHGRSAWGSPQRLRATQPAPVGHPRVVAHNMPLDLLAMLRDSWGLRSDGEHVRVARSGYPLAE